MKIFDVYYDSEYEWNVKICSYVKREDAEKCVKALECRGYDARIEEYEVKSKFDEFEDVLCIVE